MLLSNCCETFVDELQDILANLVKDSQLFFFSVAVARWSQDTLATVLQQPGVKRWVVKHVKSSRLSFVIVLRAPRVWTTLVWAFGDFSTDLSQTCREWKTDPWDTSLLEHPQKWLYTSRWGRNISLVGSRNNVSRERTLSPSVTGGSVNHYIGRSPARLLYQSYWRCP